MDLDSFHYLTIDRWFENQIIIRLTYFKGDKTKTAVSLGISTSTLYRKIKQFNVTKKYREQHQ